MTVKIINFSRNLMWDLWPEQLQNNLKFTHLRLESILTGLESLWISYHHKNIILSVIHTNPEKYGNFLMRTKSAKMLHWKIQNTSHPVFAALPHRSVEFEYHKPYRALGAQGLKLLILPRNVPGEYLERLLCKGQTDIWIITFLAHFLLHWGAKTKWYNWTFTIWLWCVFSKLHKRVFVNQ